MNTRVADFRLQDWLPYWLTVDDLIAHCRRSLASYKIPRRFEFLDTELPKSGSGKVLNRTHRDRFWVLEARAVT